MTEMPPLTLAERYGMGQNFVGIYSTVRVLYVIFVSLGRRSILYERASADHVLLYLVISL